MAQNIRTLDMFTDVANSNVENDGDKVTGIEKLILEYQKYEPKKLIAEIEKNFEMSEDFRKYVSLIKNGDKAGKSFAKYKGGIKPGDWIIEPYSKYLLNVIFQGIRKKVIYPKSNVIK